MEIRLVVPDDAEAVVSLINELDFTSFATAAAFRSLLDQDDPPGTERLLAGSDDGAVVGFSRCRVAADGGGWAWVGVREDERRRGLGSALHQRVERTLRAHGASRIRGTIEVAGGGPFAERLGYRQVNALRMQSLDLEAASVPEPPAGAVSLRDAGAESIRTLYLDALADIPSQTSRRDRGEEEFRRQVVESEIVDSDVSVVLFEDGEPVAFTVVVANHEAGHAGPQMTGVRADRRGRGLAQAVKVASIHRARAAGLRTMVTANDLENAPMLAINRKLGFEPSILVGEYEKPLDEI